MFLYIVGTMLAAGLVGGLINSYLSDPDIEKPLTLSQHIIVGIGASFMVPVFLNMISSHLISEITGNEITSDILSKILVLAGFCLLAAVSSRAFIRSMTDRLLKEVSAAKQQAQEAQASARNAEAIANLTVEPSEPDTQIPSTALGIMGSSEEQKIEISENEKKILKTMIESRFSMRSIQGIAKDSGLSPESVNTSLGNMIGAALIAEGKSKDGAPRWYPTPLGRKIANET